MKPRLLGMSDRSDIRALLLGWLQKLNNRLIWTTIGKPEDVEGISLGGQIQNKVLQHPMSLSVRLPSRPLTQHPNVSLGDPITQMIDLFGRPSTHPREWKA